MLIMLRSYMHVLLCYLKIICAYLYLHIFNRRLLSNDIWLIREKRTEARDNGYHLFKYLRNEHKEINVYYSITKNSSDYNKVNQLGKTVEADSFKHYVFWLAAIRSISSQPYGAIPDPPDALYRFNSLCNKKQKVIFLRHGIQKDELSHTLDYSNTHFNLVCCAVNRERNFLVSRYGYPLSSAQLTGFCRFDNLPLKGNPKKQILIMPTFRSWLAAANREKEATDSEKSRFMQSSFYVAYKNILSDNGLLEKIRVSKYRIVFYLHYSLQSFTSCFEPFQSKDVVIAKRQDYDVQQLLIESNILITDYSSIFFDFAYMGKPEAFYQFDEDKYRNKHYQKGYFDYRTDGFGPVINNTRELLLWIITTIEQDARIDDKYLKRINSFFDFRDNHNCERVYNAISELQ